MSDSKKKIGLIGCILMGIGCIIGSGIFGTLPEVVNDIDDGVIIALIAATAVVILRGIPAMFSCSALPSSARHFMHQTKILHPYIGVLQAFNAVLITSMLSLYGVLFAEYIVEIFPSCPLSENAIAIILIVFFCGISLFGNVISSRIQDIMVFVMLVTLVLYVIFGLPNIDVSRIEMGAMFGSGIKLTALSAAVGVLTSCVSGGAIVAEISDDVENPRRNIPLAIILCPTLVCILYILIAVVTLGVPVSGELNSLTTAAKEFMSPGMTFFFVIGGPVIGIVTSFVPFLLSMVAEFDYAARNRIYPSIFAKQNKHGVATWSVVLAMVISIVIVITGQTFGVIMVIFSFANIIEETPDTLIPFFAAKKYPKTCENLPKYISKKATYICSIISLVACVYLAAALFITMDLASWIAVLVTYGGGYIYFFIRIRYLKKKENFDLVASLAAPYEPWEEHEKSFG
ncbi:MAG: APC family permease [Emergencia sp.]